MNTVKGECMCTRLFFAIYAEAETVTCFGHLRRDALRLRRDFGRRHLRLRHCLSESYGWSQPFSKTDPETPGIPVVFPPHKYSPW